MQKILIKASLIVAVLFLFPIIFTLNVSAATISKQILDDEKVIIDIDINQCFSTDSIIIVLKSEYSQYRGVSENVSKKLYKIEEIISLEDLSEVPSRILIDDNTLDLSNSETANYLSKIKFRQIIKAVLNSESKEEVLKIVSKVELLSEVCYVGPNYSYEPDSITPDDPFFQLQWALNSSSGIAADEAWEFTRGTFDVRVGIIDSGIASHEDLNANVVTGYDFYNNNTTTIDDYGGHGTRVAGIVGAVGDNDTGVTGINHKVSLVPLQTVSDSSGSGHHDSDSVIAAIINARDSWDSSSRISVLNYSVSGFGTNFGVLAAVYEYQGLFVWSVGNDGNNLDNYSFISAFNLNNLISVGAIDSSGNRSIWSDTKSSNFGSSVSIFAPGGGETNLMVFDCITTNSSTSSAYSLFNGTSCAAPHVTGVAALLLSINPNLTASQLKTAILEGADNIVIQAPTGPGGSLENQYVKKLNAYGAVKYVLTNHAFTPCTLNNSITTINISHTALANNDYFTNDNGFYKLNVTYSRGYDFNISASYPLNVTLYDSNYNQLSYNDLNNSNNNVHFPKYLSTGTYYLRVKFANDSQSGTITTQISKHYHTYDTYSWRNYTEHTVFCACDDWYTEVHAVAQGTIPPGQQYATCIICGGPAAMGIVPFTSNNLPRTINGSYILPNGVIVLADADIDAYLNGTLSFIHLNNKKMVNNYIPFAVKKEEDNLPFGK